MLKYREDLQILRGVALILVIFYHLEFFGFKNGFLGVDLFLVLSGFLMAILAQKSSVIDFYKKRFSRLIPAYLLTLLVTTILVLIISIPSDAYQRLSRIWFDLAGLSNIAFWLENSYFESETFKPLLNLWSLGLEIQFYLIAPFLLKFLRKKLNLTLLCFFISLILSFIVLSISPKTSFFMLPCRLWQFLIGALVAWYPFDKKSFSTKINNFIVLILITLFFSIIFLYPIENNSLNYFNGHPGIASLIISIISGLLISIGLDGLLNKNNLIVKSLVKIGDYSYSVYLVHFPIITLINYEAFGGTNLGASNLGKLFLIILFTIITSYFIFNFIEKNRFNKGIKILNLIFLASLLFIGIFGKKLKNYNLSQEEIMIFEAWKDKPFYRCGKSHRLSKPNEKICVIEKINNTKNILLLGNSHADSIKLAFAESLKENNLSTFFYASNNVFTPEKENAIAIADQINKFNINKIIIHNSLSFYENAEQIKELEIFQKIMNKNNIDIFYIAPVPQFEDSIPKLLYKKYLDKNFVLPKANKKSYLQNNLIFFNFIKKNNIKQERLYFPHKILCVKEFCEIEINGKPAYFDSNHLSISGAKLLKPIFKLMANDLKN